MERVSPTVRAARLGETVTVVVPEALIVYVAAATTLLVNPLAVAMALIVLVALTVIGTVNGCQATALEEAGLTITVDGVEPGCVTVTTSGAEFTDVLFASPP